MNLANVAGTATAMRVSRRFERDKSELRHSWDPLEAGRVSAFELTEGYRIKPDAYALPDIDLTPDEAAAVAAATTTLWESPERITATQSALLKLRAAGVEMRDRADGRDHHQCRSRRPAPRSASCSRRSTRARSSSSITGPTMLDEAEHCAHCRAWGARATARDAGIWWAMTATVMPPWFPAVPDRRRESRWVAGGLDPSGGTASICGRSSRHRSTPPSVGPAAGRPGCGWPTATPTPLRRAGRATGRRTVGGRDGARHPTRRRRRGRTAWRSLATAPTRWCCNRIRCGPMSWRACARRPEWAYDTGVHPPDPGR